MDEATKKIIWSQFGASIDMLENAMTACPDKVWNTGSKFQDFWYIAYHTLFWLDFYLSAQSDENSPHSALGLTELDPEGILPDRIYSKTELLEFCALCRNKCKDIIENLSPEEANQIYKFNSLNLKISELILYNMRHVQHHTGQLNLILRLKADMGSKWIRQAKAK